MHDNVLQNAVYMKKCYPQYLGVYNRGGMALVHGTLFEFGKMLMKMICESVTDLSITKLGRYALMILYEKIMKCEKLKKAFIMTQPRYKEHEEFYDQLYKRIVTSTYNA